VGKGGKKKSKENRGAESDGRDEGEGYNGVTGDRGNEHRTRRGAQEEKLTKNRNTGGCVEQIKTYNKMCDKLKVQGKK